MSFTILPPTLHETAFAAKRYFGKDHGATHFQFETEVEPELGLRPTLSARLGDGCILCVEVSVKAYSNSLDTFVVECCARGIPVKLYVVRQAAKKDRDFAANLKTAKSRGVGVIEISGSTTTVYAEAVSLSLFALRRCDLGKIPKPKRDPIRQAERTFLDGNPVKGCQALCEELEAVTRSFAIRSHAEGWWRPPHPGEQKPKTKLSNGPWASVLRDLAQFLELGGSKPCKTKCPDMNESLIASARGLTDPRNKTSHKPPSVTKIKERDRKLRIWFETASDLLKEWYDATKPLKL
jgi:hypothetical protein